MRNVYQRVEYITLVVTGNGERNSAARLVTMETGLLLAPYIQLTTKEK